MSMVLSLRPLEQYQLETIISDAKNIDHYLFADLPTPKGLLARLLGIGAKPRNKPPLPEWAPLDDTKEVYLDKAWHGMHFMLTQTDWEGEWPLNFLIKGGVEIGPDMGYGPARGINADQVKEVAAAVGHPLPITATTENTSPHPHNSPADGILSQISPRTQIIRNPTQPKTAIY